MVKVLLAQFQGRMCGLQILLIGLIFALLFRNPYLNRSALSTYQWSLNYLALAGSLFLTFTRLIRTFVELVSASIAWRL